MRVTVILPEPVADALTAMADAEYRRVSDQAAWLILRAVQQWQAQPPPMETK